MALVPEDQRRDLVMDVTERIVEAYYDARGFQTPPYSYVLHDRLTKEGEQQLHTHVILPGLAPTVAGWEPLYNQHSARATSELFNDIAREEFEQALDRTIGPEWRRLREEPEIDGKTCQTIWTCGFRDRRGDLFERAGCHIRAVCQQWCSVDCHTVLRQLASVSAKRCICLCWDCRDGYGVTEWRLRREK